MLRAVTGTPYQLSGCCDEARVIVNSAVIHAQKAVQIRNLRFRFGARKLTGYAHVPALSATAKPLPGHVDGSGSAYFSRFLLGSRALKMSDIWQVPAG